MLLEELWAVEAVIAAVDCWKWHSFSKRSISSSNCSWAISLCGGSELVLCSLISFSQTLSSSSMSYSISSSSSSLVFSLNLKLESCFYFRCLFKQFKKFIQILAYIIIEKLDSKKFTNHFFKFVFI